MVFLWFSYMFLGSITIFPTGFSSTKNQPTPATELRSERSLSRTLAGSIASHESSSVDLGSCRPPGCSRASQIHHPERFFASKMMFFLPQNLSIWWHLVAFGGSTQFNDLLRWKETGVSSLQSVESRVCVFF